MHFMCVRQDRKRQIVLSASVCLHYVSMNLQCCLCAGPPSPLLIYLIIKLAFIVSEARMGCVEKFLFGYYLH